MGAIGSACLISFGIPVLYFSLSRPRFVSRPGHTDKKFVMIVFALGFSFWGKVPGIVHPGTNFGIPRHGGLQRHCFDETNDI